MYRLFLAFALSTVITAEHPDCTFADDEKDRGYYGMLINGEPSSEAKNGEPRVEMLCGGAEKHLYYCLNGVLKPYYDWKTRCANCTFGDVEKDKGYSGMLVNGKPSNKAKNRERNVELLCGEEKHRYVCLDGRLKPFYESTRSRCGCEPVSKSKLGYENDKYTMPPTPSLEKDLFLHGKYRNGTKWTRTCSSGPVVEGESSSICVSGRWVPKPGRCPWMCSTEQVRKDAGFSRVTSYSYPHSTWLKTGEKAQGFCSANILRVEHYGLTCADGKWLPENVSCPEHLRTHYP